MHLGARCDQQAPRRRQEERYAREDRKKGKKCGGLEDAPGLAAISKRQGGGKKRDTP